MNIKAKRQDPYGNVSRFQAWGEIKEIIIKEDFLKPEEASVNVCFRSEMGSGIVELSASEIEKIYKDTKPKMNLLKGAKVMKFKK